MTVQASNWQTQFSAALLDAEQAPPALLKTWNGSDPLRRFNVYRNNVFVNLVDGLATKFPVCQELVGEEFFRAMAHIYVREHPPVSRLMAEYGDDLPNFIDKFPPAQEVPYLADMARLEACRVAAYHAEDVQSLGVSEWQSIGQDALPQLMVELHPSVCVLASDYAVYSLWAAHQGSVAPSDISEVDPFQPEAMVIFRKELEVRVALLPPGGAIFLSSLLSGNQMETAAQAAAHAAAEIDAEFDLTATLGLVIQQELATSTTQ